MDLEDIKRDLRAEIKKRENEQYATFQCNVRQMCKDVLAKLEEQESLIKEMKEAAANVGLEWHDYDAGEDSRPAHGREQDFLAHGRAQRQARRRILHGSDEKADVKKIWKGLPVQHGHGFSFHLAYLPHV